MSKKRTINAIPVEEGMSSVYTDLGYADAKTMEIKAQLVTSIAEIIKTRSLTQAQAAKILGLTQPKISGLLKGNFLGISERRLLDCLTRLGRDVQIVVKTAPRNRETGHLTVHFG
jgi:predicted XRE-type DNA-binding protein